MYIVTATVTPLVLTMVTCQLSLPLGPLAVAVVVGLVGQAFASRELDTPGPGDLCERGRVPNSTVGRPGFEPGTDGL